MYAVCTVCMCVQHLTYLPLCSRLMYTEIMEKMFWKASLCLSGKRDYIALRSSSAWWNKLLNISLQHVRTYTHTILPFNRLTALCSHTYRLSLCTSPPTVPVTPQVQSYVAQLTSDILKHECRIQNAGMTVSSLSVWSAFKYSATEWYLLWTYKY